MAEKETQRVEGFSDGVFGIALTLLILEIKVPHVSVNTPDAGRQLLRGLLELWPSYLAFVLSFGAVLIMWINHHGLFKHVRVASNSLLFANGFLLLMITFVPFPTAVLAEYLDGNAARAAATFYSGTYVLISIAYNALLAVIARQHGEGKPAPNAALRRIRRAYYLGLIVYSGATIISPFSAFAGLAICLGLWFLWATLEYSSRAAKAAIR